jgi:glutathione S-transferase
MTASSIASSIAIHWGSGSTHSWRVLLAAEIAGVPYESKLLEFSKGEHRTPEFLAMNPRGKVPVLRDGDFVLYESLAIMQYLDRLSAGALYGTTPREVAITQRMISEFECYVREPLTKVMRHLLSLSGGIPVAARTTTQVPTREEAEAAMETVRTELGTLSRLAASRPWLAGDRVGAADAAIYPYVRLLSRVVSKAEARAKELSLTPFAATFPGLSAWCARVESLPGYERTFPPHWRS